MNICIIKLCIAIGYWVYNIYLYIEYLISKQFVQRLKHASSHVRCRVVDNASCAFFRCCSERDEKRREPSQSDQSISMICTARHSPRQRRQPIDSIHRETRRGGGAAIDRVVCDMCVVVAAFMEEKHDRCSRKNKRSRSPQSGCT